MSIKFLSSHSQSTSRKGGDRLALQEHVPVGNSLKKFVEFIPDGVFSITNGPAETKKTLLFFLEVDMGTETLVSSKHSSKDIREKILNYKDLFRTNRYKRYEDVFGSRLNGFRLLILVNTASRLTPLCRLVREMPPSDFLWLAAQEKMFSRGLSAEIWFRGGKHEEQPQSILGSKLACETTVLPNIR